MSRLRAASGDATRVAEEAVTRASPMTQEVDALGRTSAVIGDVISETIGQMDAVQARMNEVLEEQARMASALQP